MKKLTPLWVIFIIIGILSVIAVSFGYFVANIRINGSINNITGTANANLADITLTNLTENITVANGYPMTRSEAEEYITPYTFTITNNSLTKGADVQIVLETKSGTNTIPDRLIDAEIRSKTGVITNTNVFSSTTATETGYQSAYVLWRGTVNPGSQTFNLLLWIDEQGDNNGGDNDVQNKSWYGKIVVKGVETEVDPAAEVLAHLGLSPRDKTPNFTKMAPTASSYATNLGSVETTNVTDTNYYTYGTSVNINQATGSYTLSGTGVCQFSSCYSSLVGKYVVAKEGTNSSSKATTSNITDLFYVTEATASAIKTKQVSVTITFDTTGIEDGIFETVDDYGVSYYFRGDVTNNYVKFGKNANNQDMYWRIIRINGDGSIRMIYDGTQAYANGTTNSARLAQTNVAWNSTNYKDAKFVGYMYGGTNTNYSSICVQPDMSVTSGDYPYASSNNAVYNETNTNIKTQLENWYETNIKNTGYSQYIADRVFCNDRSKTRGPGYNATATTYYGARYRNYTNKIPSLLCSQKNDRFTVGDSGDDNTGNDDSQGIGNGYLKYPVGLITTDEVAFAGGRYHMSNGASNNEKYYLYKGSWYWAFSPSYSDTSRTSIFRVNDTGTLGNDIVYRGGGLAPVINLSTETALTLSGTGTAQDPFVLSV